MKRVKKLYRIACIAIGKKKVNTMLAICAGCIAFSAFKNNFDISKTVSEIQSYMPNQNINVSSFEKAIGQLPDGLKTASTDIQQPNNKDVETAVITKIADGDTITVAIGKETFKIRMLEVDTPESVHSDASKNNAYGKEASEYTKSQLSIGQTIYLTKDKSDADQYARLLRMVWLESPNDPFDEKELRAKCYNAKLLLDGYAEVAIFNDESYQTIFTRFQEEAMQNRRGLWADDSWWEFVGMK